RLLTQRAGDRADPGSDPALRDRPDRTLPGGGQLPLLQPAGTLRAFERRQGEGFRPEEGGQRAPQVGVLGGRVSDDPGGAGGEVVDAAAGEEARQASGPVGAGGAARPGRLPPVAQAAGVRPEALPGGLSQTQTPTPTKKKDP